MTSKYDRIGTGYNLTRKADKFLVEKIVFHLQPSTSQKYLDIGCGTGNYTFALHEKGLAFTGVDPSIEMLAKARLLSREIQWLEGRAEQIPLENNYFNGALATLTIHHWDNLYTAFRELNRVLKSKSKLLIFTSSPEQMSSYWLNHYFPRMLQDSMAQMPSVQVIEEELIKSGFKITGMESYFVTNDLEDLFLQSGKYRPDLYLNEQVRRGISSFATASDKNEVEKGLQELKRDIESGRIGEVIKNYESSLGDYLFVIAEKNE